MADEPDAEVPERRKSLIRVAGWLVLSFLALSEAAWDAQWLAMRFACAIAFVGCLWKAIVILRSMRAGQNVAR